ncbi:unnamed protein product [Vicia faba]|uniref:Uncharacterized protein n=1 Tax=Vicia faba TaxID=3906 RepID=A0AAV1A8V9_VICFA|nr:unnamed protein product [Vicia faba]
MFMDREAAEVLETSAAQLRATMIQARITYPLEFPLALDPMLGKKLHSRSSRNKLAMPTHSRDPIFHADTFHFFSIMSFPSSRMMVILHHPMFPILLPLKLM